MNEGKTRVNIKKTEREERPIHPPPAPRGTVSSVIWEVAWKEGYKKGFEEGKEVGYRKGMLNGNL